MKHKKNLKVLKITQALYGNLKFSTQVFGIFLISYGENNSRRQKIVIFRQKIVRKFHFLQKYVDLSGFDAFLEGISPPKLNNFD